MADDAIEGSGLQTAKDLFSGAVGGVAQVLIGTLFSFFFLLSLLVTLFSSLRSWISLFVCKTN